MLTLMKRGGIWWYRLRLSNGLDIRRSTSEEEKSRAELAALKAVAGLSCETLGKPRHITLALSSFKTKYLEWAEARLTKASVQRIQFAFLALERFLNGQDRIPTGQEGELFLHARIKQVKPVSADGDMRHLRSAFSTGVKQGWIPENPFEKISLLRLPKQERPTLTSEELRSVLDAAIAVGKDIDLSCHLAGLSGLRKGEVEAFRWEWIDWESQTLHVACNHLFTPKGKRGRTIPIHPILLECLMRYRKNVGRLIATDRVPRKAWAKVQKSAKVQVPFHSLRHTAASLWAAAGAPPFLIQIWLGHASITTTQGYVHASSQSYDNRVAFVLPSPADKQTETA